MSDLTQAERQGIEWECARLINCYANLLDACKWDELANKFAIDGQMARPSDPDVFVYGREAILRSFHARPPRDTRHICANIVITVVSRTSASGESALLLFTSPDAPVVGSFHDQFKLTDEGWQFVERRGQIHFPV